MPADANDARLADELRNFEEIAEVIEPSSGSLPRLPGIDIAGRSVSSEGRVGGDHIIYIDFNKRYNLPARIAEAEAAGRQEVAHKLRQCEQRAGILVADVSGHRITDALIAAMLHQGFLLGVYYELDSFGEITVKLFEHLNQRFFRTTAVNRYLTMIYGEISQAGSFRFISAAHPPPRVFSRKAGRFAPVSAERLVTYPPVGMFASRGDLGERVEAGWLGYKDDYTVNQIDLLGSGDLLLLSTDGLIEHLDGDYFPERVERLFAEVADESAEEICRRLWDDLEAAGKPSDDVTFVVAKRAPVPDKPLES